jgi:predicted HTH domain antitoxin
MSLMVPSDVVSVTELTEQQLAVELAVELYQREKLSLGRAAQLAGMKKFDFDRLLAGRGIPMHYGLKELEQDLATARSLAVR